jgi:DNA-binding transcriptional LysR family regulator
MAVFQLHPEREIVVDPKDDQLQSMLDQRADWTWALTYDDGRWIAERLTVDPIWACPPGARYLDAHKPDGTPAARINLYRGGAFLRPIFYRKSAVGVALRVNREWSENHDSRSLRRTSNVVYGAGRRTLSQTTGEWNTEATLWAVVNGALGDCPRHAIVDEEIARCLTP